MPNKPKRRIMKEFSIAEISAVDDPAQEPARMSIMKAKHPGGKPLAEPAPVHKKEATMPKTAEELQAELTKSADDLAKAQAKAERSEKLAELTDVEKSYLSTLSDEAKDIFLGYSKDKRAEDVAAYKKNKEAEDPIVFKAKDGTVYRKSDDDRLVEMAKRDDAREAEMRKMRDDAADAAFEKAAMTDFAKFKGESNIKGALAKAVAGIKDEDVRKGVNEMLKAAHSAVSLTLKEVGGQGEDLSEDDEDMEANSKGKAEAKLDKMAKAYATEHKVDFAKAYTAVLGTEDGKALYAKTVA